MKLQRTYLSREMTRAMALDHPIGDPFGGVAYGERNGPVVAIAAAAMSIEVGITMLATNMLVGGLMVAGGVLSGLGAITGNETLSKLGMVAGLAGGAMGMMGVGMNGASFTDMASAAFTDDKGISGMLGMGGDTAAAMAIPEGSSFAAESANLATGQQAAAIEATQPSVVSTGVTADAPYGDFYKTGNLGSGFYEGANGATLGGGTGLDLANIAGKTSSGGLFGGLTISDKMFALKGISDAATSFANSPTEEQSALAEDKVKAEIANLEAQGRYTEAKTLSEEYARQLAQTQNANKNAFSNTQFANFSQNSIPVVNQSAGPINRNDNPMYQQKAP